MPLIHLTTFIAAPLQRVFDLARSVDLHRASMKAYGEKCIAGCMSGLMQAGDEVTWQAKHLYKERQLKVKVTKLEAPHFFTDEMVVGDFRSMKHEHYFKPAENGTIMIDQFFFESPYGIFGKLVNTLYLESYMKRLLSQRNAVLKGAAEGQLWKQYLTT